MNGLKTSRSTGKNQTDKETCLKAKAAITWTDQECKCRMIIPQQVNQLDHLFECGLHPSKES